MIGEKKFILGGLLLAGSISIAGAQAVSISGKITDANTSAVVAGAKVFLVGNPNITATTGADGIFTLTGNATVGVKSGAMAKSEMSIKGTQLSLKIAGDRTPVSVDVFTLNNRFVRNLVNSTTDAGTYALDVAGFGLKSGMYVVRARAGSQTSAFKVTTLGISGIAGFRAGASASAVLAKVSADPIDSLRCTKDGYKIKSLGVTKYSGLILSVTMNPKLPPGNLKIVSERAFPQVAWGKNVDVGVFDGGTQLEGNYKAEFFEGDKSWKVTFLETQTYNGWGFLTTVEPEDMSAWKGGKLHLAVRGTVSSLAVTMESYDQGGGMSKKIDLAQYGYVPMTSITDVAWHEINVPMDAFEGTDLSQIKVYCAFSYPIVSDLTPFDPTAFYLVDDIYWTLKP